MHRIASWEIDLTFERHLYSKSMRPFYKPNQVTELMDEQRKEVGEFLSELETHDDTYHEHAKLAFGNADT